MEVSNYIKMRDQMQERFLTYDQKEIEGKYGFAFDDDYFYVPYLFEEWRVNRHTGVVEGSKDHFLHVHQGSFNETLTIALLRKEGDCARRHVCAHQFLKGNDQRPHDCVRRSRQPRRTV